MIKTLEEFHEKLTMAEKLKESYKNGTITSEDESVLLVLWNEISDYSESQGWN